jgi:hypothetical protein
VLQKLCRPHIHGALKAGVGIEQVERRDQQRGDRQAGGEPDRGKDRPREEPKWRRGDPQDRDNRPQAEHDHQRGEGLRHFASRGAERARGATDRGLRLFFYLGGLLFGGGPLGAGLPFDLSDGPVEGELLQFDDRLGQPHQLEVPMHHSAGLGIDIAAGIGGVVGKPCDRICHDRAIVNRNPSRRSNDLAPALLRAVRTINHHRCIMDVCPRVCAWLNVFALVPVAQQRGEITGPNGFAKEHGATAFEVAEHTAAVAEAVSDIEEGTPVA